MKHVTLVLILTLVVAVGCALATPTPQICTTLTWDSQASQDPRVVGGWLYWSPPGQPPTNDRRMDVQKRQTVEIRSSIPELQGSLNFWVTNYDAANNESELSNVAVAYCGGLHAPLTLTVK